MTRICVPIVITNDRILEPVECFVVSASLRGEDGRNIRVDPSNATVCIQDSGGMLL